MYSKSEHEAAENPLSADPFQPPTTVPPCSLKKPSPNYCGMHEEVGSDIQMFHNYSMSQDQPMKEILVVLVS